MKVTVIGGGPGGLYFSLLLKKAKPETDITLYERNKADDTFGFGVVFSDETLEDFLHRDPNSYERIREGFAYWDDIVIKYKGQDMRCGGNGFCGSSRQQLLTLLQDRCTEVGVNMRFESDITNLEAFTDSDIIVAADGINSMIRDRYKDHFKPSYDWRPNKFTWMGSPRPLDAFTFFFRPTEYGIFAAHSYEYQPGMGTWVIETTEETWRASGLDKECDEMDIITPEGIAHLQEIFAEELDGYPLITNRSAWRNFPAIRNENWSYKNIVLLGDAKATAHWSIGSGTRLAMQCAIALADAVAETSSVAEAFEAYELERREPVSILQHAADVSLVWFEHVKRFWHMKPYRFAFSVMSRSKQITYDNLQLRDSAFIEQVNGEFADDLYETQGIDLRAKPPPPMFAPFRLRELELANRVVVSPMAQYSALDGTPTDWHFVHLSSRALGGAGLVYTEMACPAADARITPGCAGMYDAAHVGGWRRIVDFVHENSSAKICLQLGHAGRKGSTQLGWEQMDYPLAEGNWPIYSASPIPYLPESQIPLEMGRADMDRVTAEFVRAVEYAEQAGFDMIEAHMAHGYLLASFISPLTNQRRDAYGGAIENRMRFPLELFGAMREAWPADKPMAVRISATDWHEDGLTEQELIAMCGLFKSAGADLIDVSAGQTAVGQQPVYGRMFQVPFSEQIRNEVRIPTMTVGNIAGPEQVNTIIAAGRADLVALARPHLSNPYFTLQAAAHYGYDLPSWPLPYLPAQDRLYRVTQKRLNEDREMRLKLKPKRHAVESETGSARSAARGQQAPGR